MNSGSGCRDRVRGARGSSSWRRGRSRWEATVTSGSRSCPCNPMSASRSPAPNGGGKTTLVRRILERVGVAERHLTVIPQEIDSRAGAEILDDARSLPAEELGRVMNVVSRLGSRPARLLETTNPSPGEIRKLMLALGMARTPHFIVMDEPTNHLDLPSIECLENALAGCPCGLLLVSHDERFLSRLVRTRWEIADGDLEISYHG